MADMESPLTQTLQYTEMRRDLVAYTDSLRDGDYQRRVWVRREPGQQQDSLGDVVHFFYDDTKLADDPDACIGVFLKDAMEAEAIRNLIGAIDVVFDEIGLGKNDLDYIEAPGWPKVVSFAERLAVLLDDNPV